MLFSFQSTRSERTDRTNSRDARTLALGEKKKWQKHRFISSWCARKRPTRPPLLLFSVWHHLSLKHIDVSTVNALMRRTDDRKEASFDPKDKILHVRHQDDCNEKRSPGDHGCIFLFPSYKKFNFHKVVTSLLLSLSLIIKTEERTGGEMMSKWWVFMLKLWKYMISYAHIG